MAREYVENRGGSYYLTGSPVRLELVIGLFLEGASPETIADEFPTLSPDHVNGAITFYLADMRRQHNQLGLNADLALAWHESGHAVTASALGRLMRVKIEFPVRTEIDRTGINQNDDMCIAAMGPAAQLAYMARHQKEEPSSIFYENWVYHAAKKDLKKLLQHRLAMPSEEDEWLTRIRCISRLIVQNPQIFGVLNLCAEALLQRRMLSADEVDPLVQDTQEALLHMLSEDRKGAAAMGTSISAECQRGQHNACKGCDCQCHRVPPATSPDAMSRKCKQCGYIGWIGDHCPNGHGELTEPV
jgi:uncharacterized protein (DUF433 family)